MWIKSKENYKVVTWVVFFFFYRFLRGVKQGPSHKAMGFYHLSIVTVIPGICNCFLTLTSKLVTKEKWKEKEKKQKKKAKWGPFGAYLYLNFFFILHILSICITWISSLFFIFCLYICIYMTRLFLLQARYKTSVL